MCQLETREFTIIPNWGSDSVSNTDDLNVI